MEKLASLTDLSFVRQQVDELAAEYERVRGSMRAGDTRTRGARSSNASDVAGGVLQRSNIHMAVCATGAVGATLDALRLSPKTAAAKAKFVLATDGVELEAEDLASGETIACAYGDFNVSRFYIMAYVGNEQGIAAAVLVTAGGSFQEARKGRQDTCHQEKRCRDTRRQGTANA